MFLKNNILLVKQFAKFGGKLTIKEVIVYFPNLGIWLQSTSWKMTYIS
jgi:hypothetical protein